MIKVNDESFKNFITSGGKVKILKLSAKWCNPCKISVIPCNELSIEMKDEVEIGELDIEESPNTGVELNCRGVPFFVKFQNGKKISELVGWENKQKLKEWIQNS